MDEITKKTSVEEAARKVKASTGELKDAVLENGAKVVQKYGKETEALVKNHPYVSMLAAFGIGALAGVLLARRH